MNSTDETDKQVSSSKTQKKRKARLNQSDVPSYPILEALRVATAIRDQYGKSPTKPLLVAKAMDLSPTSSVFRMITGASVAYGLTEGAAQADEISLTELGKKAVAPLEPGDDQNAIREAVLHPTIIRAFLEKYNSSKFPDEKFAINVIEDMGVGATAAPQAYKIISESAKSARFLEEVKGNFYVNLMGSHSKKDVDEVLVLSESMAIETSDLSERSEDTFSPGHTSTAQEPLSANNKIFISHGKNREIVQQLKDLLSYGGFVPVVSVEVDSAAKPVPDKVMDDMRKCAAGIVHVGAEKKMLDENGTECNALNENVLIEIGAAMALYGRKYILLVQDGIQLPSNLQGLYQVRYEGEVLDYQATMKLLKSFADFRDVPED